MQHTDHLQKERGMKVLYVEDEKFMARAVAQVLKKNNYSIDLAHDGEIGLTMAVSGVYALTS